MTSGKATKSESMLRLTSGKPARPQKVPDPLQKFYVSVASAARPHSAPQADHPLEQLSWLPPTERISSELSARLTVATKFRKPTPMLPLDGL